MKMIMVGVVVVGRQHGAEQARAGELALQGLEDGAAGGERLAEAVDRVTEALLVVERDLEGAEGGAGEPVDVDRQRVGVLRRRFVPRTLRRA